MTNKNRGVLIAVLVVVVLGIGAIYLYNQQTLSQNSTNTATSTSYNTQTQGKVVFGITDAAASMGAISSVVITVNKIEVHSQAQGWATVSTGTEQFDLLALKQSGATSLLARANVAVGTYDLVRLTVSNVVVTDNGAQKVAKLLSGELIIIGATIVNANTTSTAVFDFMTDKSLHVTGNGGFVFIPVIKMETKSNTDATIDSNNAVHINAGHVDADVNEGMDVNGEMKANFILNGSTKFDVVNDILKVTVQGENDSAIKITSNAAINAAVSGGHLDTTISVMLTTQNGKKEWVVSGLKNLILTNVYVDVVTGAVVKTSAQSGNQ